jgi:CheY-like chemotaxis protein
METRVVKDLKADSQRGKRRCQTACPSGRILALLVLGLCFGPVRMLHAGPTLHQLAEVLNAASELSNDNSSTATVIIGGDEADWQNKRLAKEMAAARPVPQTLPSTLDNSLRALIYLIVAAALCVPAALVYLGKLASVPVKHKVSVSVPAPAEKDSAPMSVVPEPSSDFSAPTPTQVTVVDYGPVPLQLDKIAGIFTQINLFAGLDRQKALRELARAFYALKQSCNVPGSRVMWQCASLLETLVTQLVGKESEVTHSSLRTVAGGIDLLRKLNQAGKLDDNLVTDPPVKLLAVDDNLVCLSAAAMALKKAFPGVDLAADGATSLPLTQAWSYDAIFLDVEMPGMDGFELCSKIHQTSRNEKTPVVFVTAHSDFDSRARSAMCGGYELIGKPFLALEISFKAFTLIVGRRLQNTQGEVATADSNCPTGILPLLDTAATAADRSPSYS